MSASLRGLWLTAAILALIAGCGAPEPTATTVPATAIAEAVAPTRTPPPTTSTPTPIPSTKPAASPQAPTATPHTRAVLNGKIDVGGHKLYIHCRGSGSPTVILEAGYGDTSQTWSLVQPVIAEHSRVCAYDRAGLGRSDPVTMSESSRQVVDELHTLLAETGVEGPHILVGHSWGGTSMRLYAERYPNEVAGLILVDSSHPDQFRRSAAVLPPASPSDSESLKAYRDWFSSVIPDPAQTPELYAPGSLGDLPLVVLSALNKERAGDFPAEVNAKLNRIWGELQTELATLSTNSRQVISEKSQHFIQQDEPQLVIDAILQVLASARSGRPLATPAAAEPPPTVPDEVASLQGLPFDTFLAESYRQLRLRDPDALVANGLAAEYGVDPGRFSDRSDAYLRQTQELEAAILDLLRDYDRRTLTDEQQLSYDAYEWYLDDRVRGHPFLYHDFPVNPLTVWGAQNWLIDFMTNRLPMATRHDAEVYVERLNHIDVWVDQLLEGLRLREEAGVIPPRFVLEGARRQVEEHLSGQTPGAAGADALAPYTAFRDKLEQIDELGSEEQGELLAAARAAVEATLVPAYDRLRQYLAGLESRAGNRSGLGQYPGGEVYYAYLLRHETGSDLTPEQVHALGLAEVSRLQEEIGSAATDLGYPPDLTLAELNELLDNESPRFTGDALLAEYERLIAAAGEAAVNYFDRLPRAELVVEPEPFGSGIAYYVPPPFDGSGPGAFYTNLDLELPAHILPTFVFHETIPGHHLQGALARELDLPAFRRDLALSGYVEGWALYAEQLAWEMGLYDNDPLGNLGRLQFELSRAARLVVDTGLHARGWTRAEAAEYYAQATGGLAVPEAMNRYVILPGQGCGYTLGLLKIRELRRQAEAQLGDRFDLKAFHSAILHPGPLPLDLLARAVDDYVETALGD